MAMKKSSLRQCIQELSEKNTDYKFPEQAINQAESLKSLSNDLYTDNIRFIYELIQNADDADASNITIAILNDKYLIISHNGKSFNEKDLQGLCGINNGTKKKDLDKIGYKGLGFKAVFGKSDNIIIYSNGEYFRFDSSYKIEWKKHWKTNDQQTWEKEFDRKFIYPWQINPIWTNENDIPKFIIDFCHSNEQQIHVANIILLNNNIEEISSAIDQLKQNPHMFLFLKNISQIKFLTKSIDIISIICDLNYNLKKIYFNKNIISQWIIKHFDLDDFYDIKDKLINDSKIPEKLRSMKKAEIFFAAKYTNEGTIEQLQDKESHLFSYLPTKIYEYKFPILINANFLTNANREQIHTDSIWNQWLFKQIGSKIFQWIKELVENNQFYFQAYRLIPSRLNLINDNLSEVFNISFDTTLKHYNFILNRQNQFLKIDEVIMDLTTISKQISFININSMREYIINYYKNSSFQCSDYPFIDYDSNLERINVRQFTWQNSIELFKSDIFIKTHSIQQNIKMIEYFYYSKKILQIEIPIEQIPFIMDQNNHLQLTKDIYFPTEITVNNRKTIDSNDFYVHTSIFNWLDEIAPKEIKEWLQKLGITERTDLTYLQKTIIPNVHNYITIENAIKTIKMLFMLFQNNNIGKKELNQLKQMKLLTIRGNLIVADQCFFSEQYNPRLNLEEYLKEKEDKFLTFDYVTNSAYRKDEDLVEWRRFFTMLGVQEELRIITIQRKITDSEAIEHGFCYEYLQEISCNYRRHRIDAYSELQKITYMEHTNNNYEFAQFFWSYVFKNIKAEKLVQHIRVYGGSSDQRDATHGTLISMDDYVSWFINKNRCIPTTLNNTCELSNKIFMDTKEMKDLCGTYMPFLSISISQDKTNWHDILKFKRKLSVNDYFDLLEKIRQDEKELKNNFYRIQMIYSDILNQMYSWSSEEQITLRTRAKKVYLLTENNQWQLANTLFIYMEENEVNNSLNDIISCLKFDYANKQHRNLQKFLDLFSIKTLSINDLKLVHIKSFPAKEFQKKLIEISPFLKKWLKHLNFLFDNIDKIFQEEIEFFESDCLKLFYDWKLVDETDVYYDIYNKKFYIIRPWKCETTLRNLPKKLCQLLNISGFENNLGFLLRAPTEEIIKYFKKYSIEISTDKDTISLKSLPKSEAVKQAISTQVLSNASHLPASSVKNKETNVDKSVNESQITEKTKKVENQKSTIVSTIDVKHKSKSSSCLHQSSVHEVTEQIIPTMNNKLIRSLSSFGTESDNKQVRNIKLIDISTLSKYPQIPFHNKNGGCDDIDLITGRIGESIVYQYLCNQYSHQLETVSIKWENEYKESQLPYDILLIKNKEKNYIEVKSTRTYNQHSFPLSINEIETILQKTENYFIYRVYIDEKKLLILDKIQWRLKHKQHLSCYLTIESMFD